MSDETRQVLSAIIATITTEGDRRAGLLLASHTDPVKRAVLEGEVSGYRNALQVMIFAMDLQMEQEERRGL